MTVICGLDIANYMGVSWITLGTPPSKWRCLTIEAEGDFPEERGADLGRGLMEQFGRIRVPNFVAVEMPLRQIVRWKGKPNAGALDLNIFTGSITARLDAADIPWGMVPVNTWRAACYGKGVKPVDPKDWKDLALEAALAMGVLLPDTKKAAKDAAESIHIARAWQKCSFIPRWHQDAFMALIQHGPLSERAKVALLANEELLL